MNLAEVKKYTTGVLKKYFSNKSTLDKFDIDSDNNLTFDGNKINASVDISKETDNAIINKSDGIFVKDNTSDLEEIDDEIDLLHIKSDRLDLAQKIINNEIEYISMYLDPKDFSIKDESVNIIYTLNSLKVDDTIPFKIFNGKNMEYNIERNSVILKKGKTYQCTIYQYLDSLNEHFPVFLSLYNLSDNEYFDNMMGTDGSGVNASSHTVLITPDKDVEVCYKIVLLGNDPSYINMYVAWKCGKNGKTFNFIHADIIEVGREIVIDPLSYIEQNNSTEDTPIGHIISYLGTTSPSNYLLCDGSIYNIEDYKELAQFIKENYGTYNFFGGDGNLTFAVPDLRGEFLRGSGNNSRTEQGNGTEVGEHQDASEFGTLYTNSPDGGNAIQLLSDGNLYINKYDSTSSSAKPLYSVTTSGNRSTQSSYTYTVRPTNTSVNYCIKAKPTNRYVIYGGEIVEELIDTPVRLSYEEFYPNDKKITLKNSILNYDKIETVFGRRTKDQKTTCKQTYTLRVENINIETSSNINSPNVQYDFYLNSSETNDTTWGYYSDNGNSIYIHGSYKSSTNTDSNIDGVDIISIRGIKNKYISGMTS